MGSHVHGLGQQLQLMPPARQNSWLSLTLDEVENQLGHLGKSLGSMNIGELLKNVWNTEANQELGVDMGNTSPASALQRQASFLLARACSGKTVDEVWRDIQIGQKMKNIKELSQEREATLGETTLEDFLAKAGLFVCDSSLGPAMGLDNNDLTPQNFTSVGLSPSPSVDTLSDTTISGRKRDASDIDKTLDRRLRRKIKNRESAARSRARKQAGILILDSWYSCKLCPIKSSCLKLSLIGFYRLTTMS